MTTKNLFKRQLDQLQSIWLNKNKRQQIFVISGYIRYLALAMESNCLCSGVVFLYTIMKPFHMKYHFQECLYYTRLNFYTFGNTNLVIWIIGYVFNIQGFISDRECSCCTYNIFSAIENRRKTRWTLPFKLVESLSNNNTNNRNHNG